MILYFSGTGNSEYAAKKIGALIGDETVDLFGRIRGRDHTELRSERPWIVVTPTYAWRMPRLVNAWLKETPLSGSTDIYFVLTCGGSIGNAGKYLAKHCADKGLAFRGCAAVVMPENYVALFSVPSPDDAAAIIARADATIAEIAAAIARNETTISPAPTLIGRLSSGIVNKIFYPAFVHAKKFYSTDLCIACGKCAAVCPLQNISLIDGRPVWGKSCTHCMACIARCPRAAIEYGKHTQGQPRYVFPKKS